MVDVSEMTAREVIARAHDDVLFGGFENAHMYEVAARALELAPEDPIVLARCLRLWGHYVMPVREGWSSVGPPRATGKALVDRALAAAERVLDGAVHASGPLRVLSWWATLLRALSRINRDTPPTAAELAQAGAECDAVFAASAKADGAVDATGIDDAFRLTVLARRRSWEILAAGDSMPQALVDRLRRYLERGACWGWPIAPLTRDPAFRARLDADLAARTANASHPPTPRADNGIALAPSMEDLAERDAPKPDERDGRISLFAWLGIDQPGFSYFALLAIRERHHAVLRRLLGLGFDVNSPTTWVRGEPVASGYTLLHEAVLANDVTAIRLLMAAGADADRVNQPAKGDDSAKQSPRDLARAKPALLRALDAPAPAGPSPSEAALARQLRTAATALSPASLRWAGSTFGVASPDIIGAIESVLARSPSTPEEVLAIADTMSVFDRYIIARVVRDAGHVIERDLPAPAILERNITASGNVTIAGVLVDVLNEATIVTAGDLVVHGLATEGDTIVGGTLRARDFVWGDGNDGSLVVEGGVATPLLVMTDHTFECEGECAIGRAVDDADAVAAFAPAVLEEGRPSFGRATACVRRGDAIFVGAKPPQVKATPKKTASTRKKR